MSSEPSRRSGRSRRALRCTLGLLLAGLTVVGTAPPGSLAATRTTTKARSVRAVRTTTRRVRRATTRSAPSTVAVPSTTPGVTVPGGAAGVAGSTIAVLPGAGTGATALSWVTCGEFDCATLNVPRDYDKPTGPTISLALRRARATGPNPIGSVLINPGGPSGSGIGLLVGRPKLFTPAAREQFHVIGFDPRGVGESTPLSCGSTRDRDARTGRQYVEAVRDACYHRQPELMPAITTANTARDMEQIRIALGEPKLNYLGISYGTYLGMVYADLFPDRVGRFMIDSAVDPSLRAIELTAGQYAVYEARVMSFLTRCSASRACPFGPSSVARYDALLQAIGAAPLSDGTRTLDRATLESATFALVRAARETTLATLLVEIEKRNTAAVTDLARLFDSGIPSVNDLLNDPDGDGMYWQVACAEGFHSSASTDAPQQKAALLAARAPHFAASAAGAASTQACSVWGQQNDTRPQPVAKPGVPPILFFGSINDNVTPAAWTRKVSTQWPGSAYVEVSGAAHGVMTNNTCANEVGSVFLLTGALPGARPCT